MIHDETIIGDCRLILGDCLDVLPTLEGGGVDAVVTDPPYGVAYSTGYRRHVVRSSTQLSNDHLLSPLMNDAAEAMSPLMNDAAEAMSPLMNDAAVMYLFAAPERLHDVVPIIRKRLEVVNIIVWDKGNCTAGDLETTYGQQWEAVVYARKSRVPLDGGRDRDIVRWSRGNTSGYEHPTQKPVGLMKYFLSRHLSASTILDPFMGSGTTGVACIQTGRKFIGIEIDPKYYAIAVKRCKEAWGVGQLFDDSNKVEPASLFAGTEA